MPRGRNDSSTIKELRFLRICCGIVRSSQRMTSPTPLSEGRTFGPARKSGECFLECVPPPRGGKGVGPRLHYGSRTGDDWCRFPSRPVQDSRHANRCLMRRLGPEPPRHQLLTKSRLARFETRHPPHFYLVNTTVHPQVGAVCASKVPPAPTQRARRTGEVGSSCASLSDYRHGRATDLAAV